MPEHIRVEESSSKRGGREEGSVASLTEPLPRTVRARRSEQRREGGGEEKSSLPSINQFVIATEKGRRKRKKKSEKKGKQILCRTRGTFDRRFPWQLEGKKKRRKKRKKKKRDALISRHECALHISPVSLERRQKKKKKKKRGGEGGKKCAATYEFVPGSALFDEVVLDARASKKGEVKST